jgi:hypothetical protein
MPENRFASALQFEVVPIIVIPARLIKPTMVGGAENSSWISIEAGAGFAEREPGSSMIGLPVFAWLPGRFAREMERKNLFGRRPTL